MLRSVFEREWRDEQPPLWIQLQALTEGMLMGAAWIVIAALIIDAGGSVWTPYIFEVSRHVDAEARIREAVMKFWSDFEIGRMPVVDPARDAETITELYPKPLQKAPLDLSLDNALPKDLKERARLKAEIKTAEDEVSRIETDLKAKLGVYERGVLPGWRITWKSEHVDTYTVEGYDRRVLRIFPDKATAETLAADSPT